MQVDVGVHADRVRLLDARLLLVEESLIAKPGDSSFLFVIGNRGTQRSSP
jgi:hypothetical protein